MVRRLAFGFIGAAALCAATVSADNRPTPVPASITLNVPASAAAAFLAGTWPNLGDSVTFAVSYPKAAEKFGPRIQLLCYQDTSIVYGEAGPYYQTFLLGGAGSDWLNTSPFRAHCVADLYYWSYHGSQEFNWLASTQFDAGGK